LIRGLDRVSQSSYTVHKVCNTINFTGGYDVKTSYDTKQRKSTVFIPAEFYGMEVEVLVFPFHNNKANQNSDSINDIFAKHLYPFDNFKFNHDEANNYE
jgi:hypothetical protein